METKFCRKCGQEKPVSEFIPDTRYRSGYQTYCRKCVNEYQKMRRLGKNEKKVCRTCGRELPISAFPKDKGYKSGRSNQCRDYYNKQHREALERQKENGFCLSEKERKERQPIADFEQKLGGFKVSILNYAEKGEYKYTVASTKGDFFQTNSKEEFINFLKERA